MPMIMKHSSGNFVFTKGAVERVIQNCTTYLTDDKDEVQEVTEDFRNEILQNMEALAVRQCHKPGVKVHMLTGDHPETAKAIAIEVGILPSSDRLKRISTDVARSLVLTASEFDSLSDDRVEDLPVLTMLVARCAPSTKVRMIEALHRRGRFCAMVSIPLYKIGLICSRIR